LVAKKAPPSQETNRRRAKQIRVELSLISMFFWGLGLFFLLAWIFILGILVGRGFFPNGVKTLTEMKDQITKLQDMVNRENPSQFDFIEKIEKDPDFEFYKELEKGRSEVEKKAPPARKGPSKSEGERPLKSVPEDKIASIEKKPDRSEPVSDKGSAYVVQIASLENRTKAAKMTERLKHRGYPAYFYKIFLKGRPFYRVRCGTFKTREEADRIKIKMADKEGMSGFVTTSE